MCERGRGSQGSAIIFLDLSHGAGMDKAFVRLTDIGHWRGFAILPNIQLLHCACSAVLGKEEGMSF